MLPCSAMGIPCEVLGEGPAVQDACVWLLVVCWVSTGQMGAWWADAHAAAASLPPIVLHS